MRNKPPIKDLGLSLWSAITLMGSLVLSFSVLAWMVRTYGETDDLVPIIIRAFLLLFAIPLIGGLLWGFGIAFLMQADARNLSRTGALNWGVSLLIAGLVLYVIMAFGPQITAIFPFPMSVHTFFNLLFVPIIGILVAIVVRNITANLGMNHLKKLLVETLESQLHWVS